MSRQKPLVTQHLEHISREVLEKHQDVIKGYIRNRRGIYVLYKKGKLYYVGLAGKLSTRLKQHLRDHHKQAWDSFSVYLTIHDEHLKELESLILRAVDPTGNKQKGKFAKSDNLYRQFKRDLRLCYNEELSRMFKDGKAVKKAKKPPTPKPVPRSKTTGRKPVLAPFVTAPFKIKWKYKGKTHTARVRADGSIYYQKQVFNSPSLAGRAVTGRPTNGWNVWTYERSPGDWVKLDTLRKKK
jgi:Restriction Enzyme Adenine Methylase Associated